MGGSIAGSGTSRLISSGVPKVWVLDPLRMTRKSWSMDVGWFMSGVPSSFCFRISKGSFSNFLYMILWLVSGAGSLHPRFFCRSLHLFSRCSPIARPQLLVSVPQFLRPLYVHVPEKQDLTPEGDNPHIIPALVRGALALQKTQARTPEVLLLINYSKSAHL